MAQAGVGETRRHLYSEQKVSSHIGETLQDRENIPTGEVYGKFYAFFTAVGAFPTARSSVTLIMKPLGVQPRAGPV